MEVSFKIPLQSLISLGPRVSVFQKNTQISNAQITKQQVNDLEYIIYPESRQLSPYRKRTILGLSTPKTNISVSFGAWQDFLEFGLQHLG